MSHLPAFIEAVTRGDLDLVRSILDADPRLALARDERGATPLHHAAIAGQREVVRLLVERGADLNCVDGEFGATPAGWAIEYLREMGGFLGIELSDMEYAIVNGDVRWVRRFLQRFPALRHGKSKDGRPFRQLAQECGSPVIAALFDDEKSE